ncbi:tyrosine-protein kinase transmembrane receptor Ror-like [Clytia hemisphaerica]|uniref:Tyrosine-protein kinase receptor n=1 Tax=Clytia hemisphaerica TaxID=252671 RepID=A0A7M5VAT6_9CNID
MKRWSFLFGIFCQTQGAFQTPVLRPRSITIESSQSTLNTVSRIQLNRSTLSPAKTTAQLNSTKRCNDKTCQPFHQSPTCSRVLGLTNQTTVKRDCRYGNNELEYHISRIIGLVDKDRSIDGACRNLTHWFLCSLVFPSCNVQNGSLLPCQETCNQVNDCYSNIKEVILTHDRTFYEHLRTDCLLLGKQKDGKCAFKALQRQMNTKPAPFKFVTLIVIGTVIWVVLLFLVILFIIYRRRHNNAFSRTLSLHEVKNVHSNRTVQVNDNFENLGITNPKYESVISLVTTLGLTVFSKENLVFDRNLGEGAFGKVVKCRTKSIDHPKLGTVEMVAVKYLKENAEAEMELTFQRELEILSNFDHPNVIPLVGVCLDKSGPMCLILEFMKYGDLNQYIRLRSGSFHAVAGSCGDLPDGVEFQSPELSYHNLLSITSQIADGVSYLASKRFVHRDIATRNILVGENLKVKISDFGLAHDIYGSDYYRVSSQKLLPLRWLSPEALSLGKFTVYSDTFAFGVTMWEIFTYGMQPYYGLNNEEVCNMIRGHKLLERPYCCPPNIYALMKSCWKFEPRHRKDLVFIRDTIDSWLEADETFIRESWKRLMLPPLSERRPTILKSKKFNRLIKRDITL